MGGAAQRKTHHRELTSSLRRHRWRCYRRRRRRRCSGWAGRYRCRRQKGWRGCLRRRLASLRPAARRPRRSGQRAAAAAVMAVNAWSGRPGAGGVVGAGVRVEATASVGAGVGVGVVKGRRGRWSRLWAQLPSCSHSVGVLIRRLPPDQALSSYPSACQLTLACAFARCLRRRCLRAAAPACAPRACGRRRGSTGKRTAGAHGALSARRRMPGRLRQ